MVSLNLAVNLHAKTRVCDYMESRAFVFKGDFFLILYFLQDQKL